MNKLFILLASLITLATICVLASCKSIPIVGNSPEEIQHRKWLELQKQGFSVTNNAYSQ